QTIGGIWQIVLNGGTVATQDNTEISAGVTFGPNIVVSGTGMFAVGPDDLLQGTVSADQNGQILEIGGTNTINQGIVQAINGGILNIDGNLTANGTITETNSTINFTGFLTSLPVVAQNGGVVNIAGTLDLDGGTLAITSATGPW